MKTMKINEYLSGGGIFSLMTDPHIVPIASYLDEVLGIKHGNRTSGMMINTFIVNGEVSELGRNSIAGNVYYMYKEKWTQLFDYIDAEIVPWTTGSTTTEVTYGKVIEDVADGSDTITRNDYISAFDSVDFADDNKREQTTEYGRGDTSTQSGTDTIEVTTRNTQAEVLVNYTMQFWSKYGLFDLLVSDVAKAICLPVYRLEDYNYES